MQVLSNLRTRLIGLLPILMVLMGIMGIALLAIRSIIPGSQRYEEINNAITAQETQIAQRETEANSGDNIAILERQIANAREALAQASSELLSDAEVQQVIDSVYSNAYARAVQVINLQVQQPDESITTTGYRVTVFQVQIQGNIDDLIEYLTLFREASHPGIQIQSVRAAPAPEGQILTLTLLIYSSSAAPGDALARFLQNAPTLPPTATLSEPFETQATPAPTAVDSTPQPTLVVPSPIPPTTVAQATPLSVFQSAISAEAAPVEECAGAPTTLFNVGSIAVVDFNDIGALRVLADPSGSVQTTRTQAYDNHRLEILAGPVCANETYYWYVRNLTQGGALGWVAEASGGDRWLCPESNPECAGE
ncbi:MAG TPA: hypothetical protein PLQ56_01995 [Aggregatilineales bacterium]|nr:hypothetical protein [Anaerolineae bacterium]HUN05338.1 hypothetical protein [Aggregatilineales bacterium]